MVARVTGIFEIPLMLLLPWMQAKQSGRTPPASLLPPITNPASISFMRCGLMCAKWLCQSTIELLILLVLLVEVLLGQLPACWTSIVLLLLLIGVLLGQLPACWTSMVSLILILLILLELLLLLLLVAMSTDGWLASLAVIFPTSALVVGLLGQLPAFWSPT